MLGCIVLVTEDYCYYFRGLQEYHMQDNFGLTALMEPFDSFWEAPSDIEKGYGRFAKFYSRNYFKHITPKSTDTILVVSCGPGYMLDVLKDMGVEKVLGIDSGPEKIAYAKKKNLNARVTNAFEFLKNTEEQYDVIIAEQEINHLTKEEIVTFLKLCRTRLKDGGRIVVHSLNGANPITGPEALAQNVDHYNTFTEYSLKQLLEYSGYKEMTVFPLQLYIFYENPLNVIGRSIDWIFNMIFKICFKFYGKSNSIFSKKIGAVAVK
jgi:SAM-dependent methyltransferase